jgi:hypothetical protein
LESKGLADLFSSFGYLLGVVFLDSSSPSSVASLSTSSTLRILLSSWLLGDCWFSRFDSPPSSLP